MSLDLSPEDLKAITLEWALRAVGRWYKEETHEERLKRYRRDQEAQEMMRPHWREEWQERWRKQQEEQVHWLEREQARLELRRKLAKQAVFDQWQRQNETGGWKAYAPERAARRMFEIRAAISVKHRGAPESTGAVLDLLSDHDYIDWMFACAERGLTASI